ncbi:MAG: hypothetical protein KIT14_08080 [bacterium]|nr:hypothetical protein [bacterium]
MARRRRAQAARRLRRSVRAAGADGRGVGGALSVSHPSGRQAYAVMVIAVAARGERRVLRREHGVRERSIAIDTIRGRVERLFAKTRTKRQGELARVPSVALIVAPGERGHRARRLGWRQCGDRCAEPHRPRRT